MSLSDLLDQIDPLEITGRVAQAVGLVIEGTGARSTVGENIKSLTRYLSRTIAATLPAAATTAVRQVPQADRKSTRLNSSHIPLSRMPSSA